MTCRTSWTIRCGVGGKRPSVARSVIRLSIPSRSDVRRRVADVDHLGAAGSHDEGRLLDRVVADGDDQVGPVDCLVDVVPLRQGSRAQIEIVTAGHGALAHLGVEEGYLRAGDEVRQSGAQAGAAGGGSQHDQRTLRLEDHLGGAVERQGRRHRLFDRMRRHHGEIRDLLAGDVLRQFQVNRPRSLFHRHAEGVANQRRDGARAYDLAGRFGQRPHRCDHVDDLEAGLLAAHDALLTGQKDHRHGAEIGIGGAGDEIQCAWAERGNADAGSAGQTAMGRRHESRRLFVPGEDKFDARGTQRLDDVEVFLAGDAEDELDPFVLERRY